LLESGIEPGTSRTAFGCFTSGPPKQLNVSIAAKLFNCFNVMGQNKNKQSQMCGRHFFSKVLFLQYVYSHWLLYLVVSHIYLSRIFCLSMVKKYDANNFCQKIHTWHLLNRTFVIANSNVIDCDKEWFMSADFFISDK